MDRQIYYLSKYWLVLFNVLIGLYLLIPVLAPTMMAYGAPQVGRLLYTVYRPACHQLPERSFFLFGPEATYTQDELWALGHLPEPHNLFARQAFLGAPDVGYKIGLCQRDVALYGGLLVAGMVFGLVRKRLRPLPFLIYGLCLLPMAIDGGTQLLSLRQSNWLLRTVTGGLVGVASVWVLYPHLETAFEQLRRQANERVRID
jgi:uncharacterized membrane protein